MRMRTFLYLALVLPLPVAMAGMEPWGNRQSAGIFVTVDGSVHTVYLDFESVRYERGRDPEIPVTFTTDIDLWVGDQPIPAGRHPWVFLPEGTTRWTLGPEEARGKSKPKEKPARHALDLREVASEAGWLAACFTPDPEAECVYLHLRYGSREGSLRLSLQNGKSGPVISSPSTMIDAGELTELRDRLREVAGVMDSVRARRHRWGVFLAELGDQVLADGRDGWITGMELAREPDRVALTIRGRVAGDTAAVVAMGDALASGELRRIFGRVGKPLPRQLGRDKGFSFEVTAESGRAEFDRTVPVAALTAAEGADRTAEEILLLEERIFQARGRVVVGLPGAQEILLEAKRKSGVLLSAIEPGTPQLGTEGLASFRITLVASGSGAALVRFVRLLEDGEAPTRVLPLRLKQGEFAAELALELTFLGYQGLSERNPRLLATIRSRGMGDDFERKREVYLRGVAEPGGAPLADPDWRRDPFAAPLEER